MKNILIEIIKGILIGISNVIPGFCSGLMAIILKSYEEYVYIFGNIFIHPIKVLKKHYAFIVGLVVGIVISMFMILSFIENYPVPTVMFFVGLIIGTIPDSYTEASKDGKLTISNYIIIIISSIALILLSFLKANTVDITLSFEVILLIFLLGIISSIAMIIPGVSGSLILMSLGYYIFIVERITDTILLNITIDNIAVLLSFGSGAIIGFIYISRLIDKLFKKAPKIINSIILGLVIASPFSAIYRVVNDYKDNLNLENPLISIISAILLVVGIFITYIVPKIINFKKSL